ncbi:MAG: AI-2E family transporter [Longicatena sp.]
MMKVHFKDQETWFKIKPWIILSVFIIVFGGFVFNIGNLVDGFFTLMDVLQPLFIGIIFAYVLNIPMKKMENQIIRHTKETSFIRKRKRPIAMFLTIFLAFIVISILSSIILPNIIESLVSLMENLSKFFVDIVKNIDAILAYFHINYRLENLAQVEQFMKMPWEKIVTNSINFLSGSASGILSSASSFVSTFFIGFTGFMFSLYLLSSKESFIRQTRKVIVAFCGYKFSVIFFAYAKRVNQTFSNFISGQLVEACILWILYYASMRLLGFPYPELIATLISIFSLIPVFGPMFAMAIGAVMMLSVDPLKSFWFVIFYQIMSQFEDNVIYPRVVGNSVGLPGLWVLLSIFVLGDLFGIFGMIIAVPTTACLYNFFADLVHYLLKKRKVNVSDTSIEFCEDIEK